MDVTPRLAVTQEQAEQMVCVPKNGQYYSADEWVLPESVTLRLPERPTMPCPDTLHVHAVPIPEGTRVEVGWWGLDAGRPLADPDEWHPVAFATLAEVRGDGRSGHDYADWLVTLSDIKPVEADHDEPI